MGRRKRQKGGVFPFGLIASAAAPLVGETVKPTFKKNSWWGWKKKEKTMRETIVLRRSTTPRHWGDFCG